MREKKYSTDFHMRATPLFIIRLKELAKKRNTTQSRIIYDLVTEAYLRDFAK